VHGDTLTIVGSSLTGERYFSLLIQSHDKRSADSSHDRLECLIEVNRSTSECLYCRLPAVVPIAYVDTAMHVVVHNDFGTAFPHLINILGMLYAVSNTTLR
jgi:hypothetical protein